MQELLEKNENTTGGKDYRHKILCQQDLVNVLPFQKTKIQQLINANALPIVRVGRDVLTTYDLLQEWLRANVGREIYY